jgi:DNA polymerase-3 subunit gamma/tau
VPAVAVESGAEWPALVAALDLQGPARQLANHCVLTARSGDVFRLRLDRSGEIFRRPQLEQKLAQALSEQLGRPLRIEISVSDAAEDTPARRQAQASDERLRAAEEAIEADPAVRAMREVFGATVQPGSVKPLN